MVCVGGDSCKGEKPESERPCNEQTCPPEFTEHVPSIPEGTVSDSSKITLPSPSGFNYIKPDPALDISISSKFNDVHNKQDSLGENVLIGSSKDDTASSKNYDNLNQPVNHQMPDLNDVIEGGTNEDNNNINNRKTASTTPAEIHEYEWYFQYWQKVGIFHVF